MIGFRYYYGGIGIQTQLTMPGLVAGGNTTAARALGVSPLMVQLADRPLGDELQLLYRWTGRFGVALHSRQKEWVFTTNSGAAFVVDQAGRTVTCHGRASDWAGATAEAFVRRVLPRIVQLQGRTVLHAAALDTGAGVVLLCGHSGAGKSTLTASLNQQLGWPILGDDMTVLEERVGVFTVLPTGNAVSLWEDSQAALAGAFEHSERLQVYASKYRCQPAQPSDPLGRPLRAVFQLMPPVNGADETVTIRPVPPAQAVALLASQAIRFNPDDRQADSGRFVTLARLAGAVPVNTLHYPRLFGALPQLAERLSAMLGLVPVPSSS
ncbi:MAG: hypothetical protein EBS05_23495 [Proteobacteria bacterium]|nr:hypothetical protein [Pseudomonadota bacterium]